MCGIKWLSVIAAHWQGGLGSFGGGPGAEDGPSKTIDTLLSHRYISPPLSTLPTSQNSYSHAFHSYYHPA